MTSTLVFMFLVSALVILIAIVLCQASAIRDLRYEIYTLQTSRDHWRRIAQNRTHPQHGIKRP